MLSFDGYGPADACSLQKLCAYWKGWEIHHLLSVECHDMLGAGLRSQPPLFSMNGYLGTRPF